MAAESVQKIIKEQAKTGPHRPGRKSLENSPTIKPEDKINTRKEVAKAAGISEWKAKVFLGFCYFCYFCE